MTSSSYILDREILGSSRPIIDAHSNAPFMQHTSYRGSYGTSSPLGYTTTTNSYHHHGYGNSLHENHETKIAADVRYQFL
jgi:hypothetical protein